MLAYDEQEILTFSEDQKDKEIYYEVTNSNFAVTDLGKVKRITGRIVSEATNNNFNELILENPNDPSVRWFISVDRELGLRPNTYNEMGNLITLTGPVLDSFGFRMIVASLGQIKQESSANT